MRTASYCRSTSKDVSAGRRIAEEHIARILAKKSVPHADRKARDLVHLATFRGFTMDELTDWVWAQDETVSVFDLPKAPEGL